VGSRSGARRTCRATDSAVPTTLFIGFGTMDKQLVSDGTLRSLIDPQVPLRLDVLRNEGSTVLEGVLRELDGSWYPIIDSVPCVLRGPLRPDFSGFAQRHGLPHSTATAATREAAAEQAITNRTFSDKWRRFRSYGLEQQHEEFLFGWYTRKLGLPDREALAAFYAGKQRILEVGPGSGFNTRFMAQSCRGKVFACDVSDAAFTTHENTRHLANCHVVQADLMDMPLEDGSFDFIIADGVLHHTPDTRAALEALFRKLQPGGQMFFYVYRKMGEARQFCDRYLREQWMGLEPEACYRACEGLTELGRELSALSAQITLSKGIPELGIPAGTHDVQRLFYYNFVKCFWNDAFDFETNNMVNFDWYHPHNAWQHTDAEVEGWLAELGVKEFKFNDANPNGISCLFRKPA
jgi:SAM-dependent methyltransferase